MRSIPAAFLLLLGAACAGPLTVSGPGVLVSSEPPPPSGAQVDGLRVEKGMNATLTVTSEVEAESGPGPEPGEGGADPVSDAPSSPESGVDQYRRAHNPEDAGSSPAPATAPEPPTSFVDVLAGELDANRAFVLELVLGILDRTAAPVPPPENSTPAVDPEAAAFVGPPSPALADDELREIIREDEGVRHTPYRDIYGHLHIGVGHRMTDEEIGDLYDEDLTEAEAEAKRFLGTEAFDGLDRWRRNGWIVLCYWSECSQFVRTRDATLAADWDLAADEVLLSILPKTNRSRAEELSGWFRTGTR